MAAPHPETELERAKKLAKAGLPRAVAVVGPNAFFRAEATAALAAAVPKEAELRTIDGTQETDGRELLDLRGGGLFTRSSFLVVRRAEDWLDRHGEALLAVLPAVAPGCGVVLETARFDKRTRLAKAIAEGGAVLEFRELYETPWDRSRSPAEGELAIWVGNRARKLGLALTPDAAWTLVASVGTALPALLGELERLRAQPGMTGRTKPLRPEDLHGKLTVGFQSTPFEFAEAVLANDRPRALRSLRAMFDRGIREQDPSDPMKEGKTFPFTTSWLWRSLAQVHEGRVLLDSGVPLADVAGRAGVTGFQDRFREQVRQNPEARLRRGLLAVVHCQRVSRRTSEEPDVLLERFLDHWFDGVPVPAATELEL